MRKNRNIQKTGKVLVIGFCVFLTGCGAIGLAQESQFESAYENTPEAEEPVDIYTSAASGIIEGVDAEEGAVSIYLRDRNESRSFAYTGVTAVQDKYGSPMSVSQLKQGDLAEITYNSELERLGEVKLSADAWSYDGISQYDLNGGNGTAIVGGDTYGIDEDVCVFSGDKRIGTDQIVAKDVLTVKGIGHKIISIVVEKGHGYLELVNDEALIGGWIEVGQTIIQQITPDMLLTVPEGSYTVRLTAGDIEEAREILIERDKEAAIDLGDIEIKEPQDGKVIFSISPENARVFVDDTGIDTKYAIRLAKGLHRVTAEAEGYDSLSEYFKVEEETTRVSVTLEKAVETVSGNTLKDKDYMLTIDTPAGAEVYQDNVYMGIAPVTYVKTAGSHVITLRRTGYITRSYTIQVDDEDRDVTYSFPELDFEKENSTISGNSAAGQTGTGSGSNQTVSGNSQTVSGNDATVSGNN